jgi:hypothetical protein
MDPPAVLPVRDFPHVYTDRDTRYWGLECLQYLTLDKPGGIRWEMMGMFFFISVWDTWHLPAGKIENVAFILKSRGR